MSDREIMDSKFSQFKAPSPSVSRTPVTPPQPEIEYMPDQRMHRIVSFVKSGFRIVGAIIGMTGYVPAAFGLFFLAEVVGIYEELV